MNTTGETEAIYNIDQVSRFLGLDAATIRTLSELLLNQTQTANESLRASAKKADHAGIIMLAHDIKGSCANLRFTKISELAFSVEKMAKDDNLPLSVCTEICDQIDEAIDLYKKAIGF